MMRVLLTVVALWLCLPPAGLAESNPFPRPPELEPDVQFWIRIYSEVGTDGGLIHDSRKLGVVYEKIHFPSGASQRARQRQVDGEKRKIKQALLKLAGGKRSGLSAYESRVLGLWPEGVSNATLRAAASRLRFQLGQANKFRAGIIRSGAFEPHIRQVLSEMDLPPELAALPHVESSFTPYAYSSVGAAGLWQFTRSTGRRYMRVDHVVDERLDPFRSTLAAARLLQHNRQTTGSWPLAITAYNHGAAGMRRAVRQLGTDAPEVVLRKYKSRTFGFASRNFYVEFLAAVEVDHNSAKFFGPLVLDTPIPTETMSLPYFTTAGALQRALGVDMATLKANNPALRGSVWGGAKYVPKDFAIRVPRDELSVPIASAVAAIPESKRHARQVRDTFHTVRRGENLSTIARRYGVRMSDIVALNGLRSRHRIWAGQKLRLPDPSGGTRMASVRPAPALPVEPPTDGRYTVRRGDTITSIAARFGLDERELARRNGLRNRNRIYVGQTLRVGGAPEGETTAAPPAEEPTADPHPQTTAALSAPSPAPPEAQVTEVVSNAPGVAASEPEPADPDGGPASGPGLLADPSDYSVAPDGTIEVQAAETLGHYAEWLDIRASRLRQINGLRYGRPLELGRPLKLDLSQTSPAEFERRRLGYHRALQGEFFAQYEIAGTQVHVMRRGDSLWTLSQRKYKVPIWLLRQFNPDVDFEDLHAGMRLTVPLVQRHNGSAESGALPVPPPASSEASIATAG